MWVTLESGVKLEMASDERVKREVYFARPSPIGLMGLLTASLAADLAA